MKAKSKFINNLLVVILTVVFLFGCERVNEVAIVKNNSSRTIFIIYTLGKVITDSSVKKYYSTQKNYMIKRDSFKRVSVFNRKLNTEPDSSKVYLYVFDSDSLKRYSGLQNYTGLLNHSLMKRIEIQLNTVKNPLDTVFIK